MFGIHGGSSSKILLDVRVHDLAVSTPIPVSRKTLNEMIRVRENIRGPDAIVVGPIINAMDNGRRVPKLTFSCYGLVFHSEHAADDVPEVNQSVEFLGTAVHPKIVAG